MSRENKKTDEERREHKLTRREETFFFASAQKGNWRVNISQQWTSLKWADSGSLLIFLLLVFFNLCQEKQLP